jgi:Signal peptide binding domain
MISTAICGGAVLTFKRLPRFPLPARSILLHAQNVLFAADKYPRLVRSLQSSGPRSMGILDTLRSSYKNARGNADEKREKLIFDVQMGFLTNRSSPIDGNSFLDLLASMKEAAGIGGFKENLPWVQNNPMLSELKEQQAVIHAMSPAERGAPTTLGIAAKKRVARSTGQSLGSIDSLLTQISTMRNIQKWLIRRTDDGLPLPTNSRELQAMLTAPGSGISRRAPAVASKRGPKPGVRR